MRKTKLFLRCLGTITLMAFSACSDDTPVATGGGNDGDGGKIEPVEVIYTEAFYKGDLYETGTGNLWINFRSDMKLDAETGNYIGPGYVLCLDFNTALAENADFAKLAEGTYKSEETDTHNAFTLNVADGDSYLTRYEADGTSTMLEIVYGTVAVITDQGRYQLDATLTLEDGSDYPYTFDGELVFINRSDEGKWSNLTDDVSVSGLSQALIAYSGQAFTETSDLYIILLAGPEYDLGENYGMSDALMISVNVPPGTSDGIPSGTYTMIDMETADDYPVGTALSGVFNMTYGGYFGTWFYSTKNKQESSMRNGEIIVTNSGDGSYTIKFSLQDGYGHRIDGSYKGACRIEDWS